VRRNQLGTACGDEAGLALHRLPAIGAAVVPVVIAGHQIAARTGAVNDGELRSEASLVFGATRLVGGAQPDGIDVVAEEHNRDALRAERAHALARLGGERVEQGLGWRARCTGVANQEERRIGGTGVFAMSRRCRCSGVRDSARRAARKRDEAEPHGQQRDPDHVAQSH